MQNDIERILLSEDEISAGIERIAVEIGQAYDERELTVVCVLKGSCIFASDLIRRLRRPLALTFVCAESYRDAITPGELELRLMPRDEEVRGANLLLVDDILDSGRTLDALRREFLGRGAQDVKLCTLLDKPARRVVDVRPDFLGFAVEDHFVVGYGLDHAGRFRNLPYVGILREAAAAGDGGR